MKITIESIFKDSQAICDHLLKKDDKRMILKIIVMILVAGGIYGFTMGIFNSVLQGLVSAIKVPLLFFATLLICTPTLHFMGLLLGSKLRFLQSITILLWAIAVNCVLLAAFAPISLFFMLSNSSYAFMMGLHVLIFTICGAAGLTYVNKNFRYVRKKAMEDEKTERSSGIILLVWMLLYMFVGSQMAFIMSPFVGKDNVFMLFTGANYNFYTYILEFVLGL